MPDDAVVRVVVQGESGDPATSLTQQSPSAQTPQPPQPPRQSKSPTSDYAVKEIGGKIGGYRFAVFKSGRGIEDFGTRAEADALVAKLQAQDAAKMSWVPPEMEAIPPSAPKGVLRDTQPPPPPPVYTPEPPISVGTPSERITSEVAGLSGGQPPEPPDQPPGGQPPEPPEEPKGEDEKELRKKQREADKQARYERWLIEQQARDEDKRRREEEREEQRQTREEEKRLKREQREEEKRQRDEERESKRQAKEDQRRIREEERERKRQEKEEEKQARYARKLLEEQDKDEEKRLRDEEREEQRQERENEKLRKQNILDVIPVHDPYDKARNRRKREIEKAQEEEAYKDLYGEEEVSDLDKLLEVANSLRGSIGGMLGPLVGAGLDLASGMRKQRAKDKRDKRRRDLLEEVEGELGAEEEVAEAEPAEVPTVTGAREPRLKVGPLTPEEAAREFEFYPDNPERDESLPWATVEPDLPEVLPADRGIGGGGKPPVPLARGAGGLGGAGGGAGGGLGGLGGMAGAAAAAGPIVALVMAAKELQERKERDIIDAIKANINVVGSTANFAAEPSADVAKNLDNFASTIDTATIAVNKVSKALYGSGLHAAVEIVTSVMHTFAGVLNNINQTADRYAEYSPAIAQAQAVAEIRQTMGDFRRAQKLGAEMSKFILAQSDVQQKFEDIKVKALNAMLPMITKALEMIEVLMNGGELTAKVISELMKPLTDIANAVGWIAGMQKDKDLPEPKDPTDLIMYSDRFKMTPNERDAEGEKGLVPFL